MPRPAERAPRRERFDHERQLEASYRFDKGDYANLTTLAWVSLHQDELAREFQAGRQAGLFNDSDRPEVRLIRWEVVRFGGQLEEAAHRILRFAVRKAF